MIVKMKHRTKAGSVMEMDNCPIPLGIEILFHSCDLKEKQEVLGALQDIFTTEEAKEILRQES